MDRPLRRVVEMADGWMTVNERPDGFANRWAKVQQVAREAGREPGSVPNILYHNININPDADAALDESKRFLDVYYGPVFPIAAVKAWTTMGTPDQCVEQIRALRDLGAEQITFRITSWRQEEQFEQLVRDVLPYVNA